MTTLPNERQTILEGEPNKVPERIWYRWFRFIDEFVRFQSGTATFVASDSVTVTLQRPIVNKDYIVLIGPTENNAFWYENPNETEFTLRAASSTSATIGWAAVRIT